MNIDVQNLSIALPSGRKVVDSISFTLADGERLGIVGESGSGKSVTTLAVMGLLPRALKAEGSILVGDTQIVGAGQSTLRQVRGGRVAMVFQDPSTALDPLMRIGRQLEEPLQRHQGLSGSTLRDGVLAALAEVRLPDPERMIRSFPFEVSGGQRQRVAIAMALACQPQVLIADEPTTALDVTVQADILTLIRQLCQQRGMGLIFVSHDLAVVSQTVTRGLVMERGRIVEEGTIDQLIGAPTNPYTQKLVGSARALDEALITGRLP